MFDKKYNRMNYGKNAYSDCQVRSAYYNYYTGYDWGKPSDYSYCINVADNSENEIVALLAHIYEMS